MKMVKFIVSCGALSCLLNLLTRNHKKGIKREACWLISNITAGNKALIQAVIDAGFVGPIVNLLQTAEFNIKKEAAWVIYNAIAGGSPEQIRYLVSQNCIKPLCDLLVCQDPKIITICLLGLDYILKVGEAEKNSGASGDVNFYAQLTVEAEGLEKIENLQFHLNDEIYQIAVKILKKYWWEEVEEVAPPSAESSKVGFQKWSHEGRFKFGA